MTDVYHHVLGWKACYTSFAAVLFKPTSRTSRIVSINSPSGEGGGVNDFGRKFSYVCSIVSINSPSGEGGGFGKLSISKNSEEFPLILLQAKAGGV